MAEDEPEQPELEAQMEVATEAIRTTVLRLLQEGRVHPQLLILAVTQIAGELGASAALASGREVEELLGELAKVLQQAGRDHHETLQALALRPWPGAPERACPLSNHPLAANQADDGM